VNYKASYDKGAQRIENSHKTALQTALGRYGRALDAARQKAQKRGDLEGLIALKKEALRFKDEGTVPGEPPAGTPDVLAQIQTGYHQFVARAENDKNKNMADLLGRYLGALDTMKKQYVVEGKISKALEVRNEIKRAEVILAVVRIAIPEAEVQRKPSKPRAVRRGLILHYSFDQNEGSKVTDRSGKRNHGEVHGAKWTRDGKLGAGYSFDGRGYISAVCRNLPKGNRPRTMALWVYVTNDNNHMHLMGYGNDRADDAFSLFRYKTNDRVPANARRVVLYQAGTDAGQPESYANSFLWVHLTIVHDGNTATLFVNGEKKDSDARSFSTTVTPLYIGRLDDARNAYRLTGNVDEVMVFDRALSEREVKSLYASQK